jgi:hypothetical protein
LFDTTFTAQTCGLLFGRRSLAPIILLAIWIGFGWPLFLSQAPTHRELLRLPLSRRDAGAVLFLLRVILPCICVMLLTPVLAPLFTRSPVSPLAFVAVACGLCAAFPLMSFTPFVPSPPGWRLASGAAPESCEEPGLRWLAAGAVWVLAPAIAVIPFVSIRLGYADWPWLSLALGVGLAWLAWTQRERLARAASANAPEPAGGVHAADRARWQGWRGFVPLLAPIVAAAGALGLGIGLLFTLSLQPAGAAAMVLTFVALGASLSANLILRCIRVLRLLPIGRARLACLVLAMLCLPTIVGCLLGATLAHAWHPDRMSVAHMTLFCLLGLTCNVVLFVPVFRSARHRIQGPLFAGALAVQVAVVLAGFYFGLALPPDGWLLVVCLVVLGACLASLTGSLKSQTLRSIAAFALASLACLPVSGAEPPDPARYAAAADAMIKRYVDDGRFSGAVLVAVHGKPVLREGFGLANREWDIPVTPETEFRIGSMTKQFTATAILQLAEQGKLALSDPIGKYYAAAPKAWNSVTIAQLLSHRSGIPNFTELPGFDDSIARRDLTPEQVIALTRDAPLHFAPGSQYEYSNSGYALLGYVIEKQSGQPYADYLREHVFHPLGMGGSRTFRAESSGFSAASQY